LQITEKCLPSILQLQHLEDLVLEGCLGIDDDGLSTLQQSCKSLKVPFHYKLVLHCLQVANFDAVCCSFFTLSLLPTHVGAKHVNSRIE